MKNTNVCPGCHKHCKASGPRCKYGVAYFAKLKQKESGEAEEKQKHYKWERHVEKDGPAWKLITASRQAKKALCHRDVTEEALFSGFTDAEKELFSALISKLNTAKPSC